VCVCVHAVGVDWLANHLCDFLGLPSSDASLFITHWDWYHCSRCCCYCHCCCFCYFLKTLM